MNEKLTIGGVTYSLTGVPSGRVTCMSCVALGTNLCGLGEKKCANRGGEFVWEINYEGDRNEND